jgi:roadblock/LC7 domain-containing protein
LVSTLEELLTLDGVVAAVEFRPDGSLADFESHMDMSSGLATMAAQFCATVTMLFDTLAPAFQGLSGMDWTPQQGWAYRGGDYTVVIGGSRSVFAETGKADLNTLFGALVGESPSS